MSIFTEFPPMYRPNILESDRKYGSIKRYFCRRLTSHSAIDIVEVTNITFNALNNNPMYSLVEMEWKISGQLEDQKVGNQIIYGVINANKKSIESASKQMKGLDHLLLDYKEFYNA